MVSDKHLLIIKMCIWSVVNNFNYNMQMVGSKYYSINSFNDNMQVVSGS